MSQKRQTAIFDPRGQDDAALTTLIYRYPKNHSIAEHFHREAQLVFAVQGVMSIRTQEGSWLVPPNRAVWIPASVPHSIQMSGIVEMRTLYFEPGFARGLPRACGVLNVTPFCRELIVRICELGVLRRRSSKDLRWLEIIKEEMARLQALPLMLPLPRDPRSLKLAEHLLLNPGDPRTLHELSRLAGASKRTLERFYLDETGLSVGRWRQQLRILHAVRLLAGGSKITDAALEAGYESPSAFIAMFKKTLGMTPSRYLQGS
ncbi:MAG: AraC family transcriptional regulator [Bdellovibrionota bacterium]